MAKSLYISGNDVFRNTLIQADLDPDKLSPFIEAAQDVDIQDWLGQNLYVFLDDLIFNAGQTPLVEPHINQDDRIDYKNFIINHLKPITEQYAAIRFLRYAKFTISNKGVFVHSATDSTPADKEDVQDIINAMKDRAEFYKERAQDFLCTALFPEYITTGGSDLPPSYETYDYGFTSL